LTYEYRTTGGNIASFYSHPEEGRIMDSEGDDPVQPEGEGWELVAMAASTARLYWAWRRKVSVPKKTAVQP